MKLAKYILPSKNRTQNGISLARKEEYKQEETCSKKLILFCLNEV